MNFVIFAQTDSNGIQYHTISNDIQYGYHKPKLFDIITNIPRNYVDLGKGLTKKGNLVWIGATAVSTAIIFPTDQNLTNRSQNLAIEVGLSRKHSYQTIFGGIEYPTNLPATFYYFGHGNVSLLFAGGFLATGLIKKDYRAINTSIEIGESILTLGIMTQGLKRVFGRQSPNMASVDGGKWDFFPNQKEYMKNTANFDAMPSGHMATLVSTITVIAKNYPEVKWIKPIGYSMTALLGFEMMNSGVHWASDYPLGILIGYSVASVSLNRRITKVQTSATSYYQNKIKPKFFISNYYGIPVYGVMATF